MMAGWQDPLSAEQTVAPSWVPSPAIHGETRLALVLNLPPRAAIFLGNQVLKAVEEFSTTEVGMAVDKPSDTSPFVPKSKSNKYQARQTLTRNGDITVITQVFVLVTYW